MNLTLLTGLERWKRIPLPKILAQPSSVERPTEPSQASLADFQLLQAMEVGSLEPAPGRQKPPILEAMLLPEAMLVRPQAEATIAILPPLPRHLATNNLFQKYLCDLLCLCLLLCPIGPFLFLPPLAWGLSTCHRPWMCIALRCAHTPCSNHILLAPWPRLLPSDLGKAFQDVPILGSCSRPWAALVLHPCPCPCLC